MSVKHIGLVLDHLNVKPAIKLVAVVLADHADSDGVCWPSYRRISARTNMDERSVRRHVKTLIEMGVVVKLRTGSIVKDGDKVSRISNAYKVRADVLMQMKPKISTDESTSVEDLSLEGGSVVLNRGAQLSTKPSINHQYNRQRKRTSKPVDIEEASLGNIIQEIAKRRA